MMNLRKHLARLSLPLYLTIFQVSFIILMAFFGEYKFEKGQEEVPLYYAMWQDVHTMMFVGFGFLMTFLKKYGYSSLGFNMLLAAYVIEWSLLVRGWISDEGIMNKGKFTINIPDLLIADFCTAAILISFGAVLGKTSPTQLLIMATIEVVFQSVNEYIGLHYLAAYDIGESMYVHAFGAFFGLTVAKVLHNKQIESDKESAVYHSDLFSMIGTLFLWLFWPSFNSALAEDEGQMRAIINTLLSIASSCISTFAISHLLGKGKINMVHIQNATLAGGVAVGTIADMMIHPFGAMCIGTGAGVISTLGYQYLTPLLKRINLHDTCGVNNLHGLPGILSGLIGILVAGVATNESYGKDSFYKYYKARIPVINSTEYFSLGFHNSTRDDFRAGGWGRSAGMQAGFQAAGLAMTLGMAVVGGLITGLILKCPLSQVINNNEKMFDDGRYWETPEDFLIDYKDDIKDDIKEERL